MQMMVRSIARNTLVRSSMIGSLASALIVTPAKLESQSWLTYHGNVEGQFTASCPMPVGGFARKSGKVMFNFLLSGNDAKTIFSSEWHADPRFPRSASREDEIDAKGNAIGSEVFLDGGARIRWIGRFDRAADGSVRASGEIKPNAGDQYGCVGTWSAGAAGGPTTTEANCAEYGARIEPLNRAVREILQETPNPFNDLADQRKWLRVANTSIAAIKAGKPSIYDLARLEKYRSELYPRINANKAVIERIKDLNRRIARVQFEAESAGCGQVRTQTAAKSAVDQAIDEILQLDAPATPVAPPTPAAPPSPRIIGVAGVRGQVEVVSQDGSRYSPRDGARIGLDRPVTIRTGPGSSITIQVGTIQKTIEPLTTIRIAPNIDGRPDFVEEGAATTDVQSPRRYELQTPTATADVDGTVFTVAYDGTTGVTAVQVEEGRVTVRPTSSRMRAVTLGPGEYVEVGRNDMTAVVPAPRPSENAGRDPPENPFERSGEIDLTGLWRDDTGGGAIYRVRQVGNYLYWIVDGTPKGSYVNVAYGPISGNTVTAIWVDMPGSPTLSGGNLTLRIESNDRLVKVGAPGYGAQSWTRVSGPGGNR